MLRRRSSVLSLSGAMLGVLSGGSWWRGDNRLGSGAQGIGGAARPLVASARTPRGAPVAASVAASLAAPPGSLAATRRVVALEPLAQPVEAGEEDPLRGVRLVQLVPHLPLERRGDHDAVHDARVAGEPRVLPRRGVRQEREEREL